MKKHMFMVIGDGISAWATLFLLKKEIIRKELLDRVEILQIANEDLAPSCSKNSLSINSLWGTKKGLSPLGDLVVDSYDLFKEIYLEHDLKGVEEGKIRQYWNPLSQKNELFIKRFENFENEGEFCFNESDGYFLSQELLSSDLKERFFKHSVVNDFIYNIEENKVYTKDSGEFPFDKLILCTSNQTKLFFNLYKNVDPNLILNTKPVQGSFLEFNQRLSHKAFLYSLEEGFIAYKPLIQKLFIGASGSETDSYVPNINKLKSIYEKVYEVFGERFQIPSFNEGIIKTGIRQKGIKRMPFYGEIDRNIYALHSLYKNGFSFSFYGASELVKNSSLLHLEK